MKGVKYAPFALRKSKWEEVREGTSCDLSNSIRPRIEYLLKIKYVTCHKCKTIENKGADPTGN